MAQTDSNGASALEEAYARAGRSIAQSLTQAAEQGELSFKKMTANVLADLARVAIDRALPQASGASASGLTSDILSALFGAGGSHSSGGVTVNMQVHGVETSDFSRSKGQVAQSLAQAVSDGMRRL